MRRPQITAAECGHAGHCRGHRPRHTGCIDALSVGLVRRFDGCPDLATEDQRIDMELSQSHPLIGGRRGAFGEAVTARGSRGGLLRMP